MRRGASALSCRRSYPASSSDDAPDHHVREKSPQIDGDFALNICSVA
jgi:hypothetical protein